MDGYTTGQGFSEDERAQIGRLYWEAFAGKLSVAFADPVTGRRVITASLRSDRVLVARLNDRVVGACGFYDGGHGAVDVTWLQLRAQLTVAGALWAAGSLSLLQRRETAGTMTLNGLCVDPDLRGLGVGSLLLESAAAWAREHGVSRVQLSVIDANPRAAALYRRHGFRPVDHANLGPLRHLFGFDGHTTMGKEVAA